MNFNMVLEKLADLPLFHSSMLRVFDDDPAHIQIQLSRWSKSGKLRQIRRGWYLVEEPYRRRDVSDALIANTVVCPPQPIGPMPRLLRSSSKRDSRSASLGSGERSSRRRSN